MRSLLTLLLLLLSVTALVAQDNITHVYNFGAKTKNLTQNEVDIWILQAKKGEILIVHVDSGEFDPVLQLVRKNGEAVTKTIDDAGSESRFRVRLPGTGEYHVLVHAFKKRGGGNYRISFNRFRASPVKVGSRVAGTFDMSGTTHHYFQATKGSILIPDARGARITWTVLDPTGRNLSTWSGTARAESTGEHTITLTGRPREGYSLLLREARLRDWKDEGTAVRTLEAGEMDVWRFDAIADRFRVIEVQKQGNLLTQLVPASVSEKEGGLQVDRRDEGPAFVTFPSSRKGDVQREYVLFRRAGRFVVHLLARSRMEYRLRMFDPTLPLPAGSALDGRMAVGGTALYTIRATAGQIIHASVDSGSFDAFLRLYDGQGNLLVENDDGGENLNSRISLLVKRSGCYRLQISSTGNGGGGAFRVRHEVEAVPALEIGKRSAGRLGSGGEGYWSFRGEKGRTVLVLTRSAACDVAVELFGPDGVGVKSDDDGGVGSDSLMAVRLPESGQYILKVSGRQGEGNYEVRLIDGE